MNYNGVIIEESLDNTRVLRVVRVLETEIKPVTVEYKTPWVKQWTLHKVEITQEKSDEVAKMLSEDLDKKHNWYADYKNDEYHYIIYSGKVFKVDLKNPLLYKDAKEYGSSLGIPEYQLDFVPSDKI